MHGCLADLAGSSSSAFCYAPRSARIHTRVHACTCTYTVSSNGGWTDCTNVAEVMPPKSREHPAVRTTSLLTSVGWLVSVCVFFRFRRVASRLL